MDKETRDFLVTQFKAQEERFDAIDNQFKEQEQRFDAIDNRFKEQEQRFDAKLDTVSNSFDAKLDTQLRDIVSVIQDMGSVLATLKEETDLNSKVLLRLENRLQEKVEAQGDDIESVKLRLDRIENHLKLPRSMAA